MSDLQFLPIESFLMCSHRLMINMWKSGVSRLMQFQAGSTSIVEVAIGGNEVALAYCTDKGIHFGSRHLKNSRGNPKPPPRNLVKLFIVHGKENGSL